MRINRLCILLLSLLLAGFPLGRFGSAESSTVWYENGYNYVDTSMDISNGIPSDATGVLGQILRRGTLRVAIDPNCSPQVYPVSSETDGTSYAGADINLAQRIAERMGVDLKFVPLDSTQILPALTEDQCDISISAIRFTPGRALSYTMSKGYYYPDVESGIYLLVREGSEITSLDDLTGKIVTVQSNSLAEAAGVKAIGGYLEFRRVSSAKAVFESVRLGESDAGIVTNITAGLYFKNNPNCGLRLVVGLSLPLDNQYLGYRVAAKKGETQLAAFVNGVIDEIVKSEEYETWLEESEQAMAGKGL